MAQHADPAAVHVVPGRQQFPGRGEILHHLVVVHVPALFRTFPLQGLAMEDLGDGAHISGVRIAIGDAVGERVRLEAPVGRQMGRDDERRMDTGLPGDRHQTLHPAAVDGQISLLGQGSALSR